MDKDIFINKFVREIKNDNAAFFIGAGLSINAGITDWKGLVHPLANELKLDVNKEHDLIAIAQYYCNQHGGNRGEINRTILDEFSGCHFSTENHNILASLPVKIYWTTNYDKLIENSFQNEGKIVDIKYAVSHLANTTSNRDVVLYKMHGDISSPENAILTKDDYEGYHITMAPFINALTGDLISKTFLFLGFSFNDPNIDYVLSRVRLALKGNQRTHYCIIKEVLESEFKTREEYEYNKIKQQYEIEDLKRFNVQTILIQRYSEITDILKTIKRRCKQKTIFISSAISDYSQYPKETVENFLQQLSSHLIIDGYNIVTGYGLGAGNAILQGAFNEIYLKGKGHKEQLEIKPFPQIANVDKKILWTQHRKNMLANCGVAIFLFGNKYDDTGEIINSPGMKEEFNIAQQYGAFLLPVGETGYMAKELFDETVMLYDNYNGRFGQTAKDKFEALSVPTTDLSQTTEKIINILNSLK